VICPHCGFANIEGADECQECQQPLSNLGRKPAQCAVEERITRDRISLLAPRKPLVVSPKTTVGEVLRLMVDRSIGCLVVVDADQVVGIFTERDALIRLNERAIELKDRPISEFMTSSPQTLEADDRIAFALHKMDLGGYRHLPILTAGRLTGIISVRDVLRYVSEHLISVDGG
jgi:CBS domain-containing protein